MRRLLLEQQMLILLEVVASIKRLQLLLSGQIQILLQLAGKQAKQVAVWLLLHYGLLLLCQ